MSTDVYTRLAQHLDDLPGGFPATESGVEQRLLRRLFTTEEAELALHLNPIAEEARVVARRAGLPLHLVAERLQTMERKGLVYAEHPEGKAPRYMATQFAIGIYEFQVNKLDPELARDLDEYLQQVIPPETWGRAPQLRTIPVGESIPAQSEVLPYEQAEAMVRSQTRFAVALCICRKEQRILGHDCGKPLETCLLFGGAADYYVRNDMAREIHVDEALAILQQAEESGLVLQPNNAQKLGSICTCCGCCCAALRTIKRHPLPGNLVNAAFRATLDADLCEGCGVCVTRCQMEALSIRDGHAVLSSDRCIGCGLCVTTCTTKALTLARRPKEEQPRVPRNAVTAYIATGQARGKLVPATLVGWLVRSLVDRLRARIGGPGRRA